MTNTKRELESVFKKLDKRVSAINRKRQEEGIPLVPKAEVTLLGQMSLLADDKVSAKLSLAQTGDLDALLSMNQVVKEELKELLKERGLLYDEDSYLIWIPKGAEFLPLFDFKNVLLKSIDPESALVSKAVKAPEKNKQLIREAIASGMFPDLMDKIEKNGGDLEFFTRD